MMLYLGVNLDKQYCDHQGMEDLAILLFYPDVNLETCDGLGFGQFFTRMGSDKNHTGLGFMTAQD
jgi:hypothetical protein